MLKLILPAALLLALPDDLAHAPTEGRKSTLTYTSTSKLVTDSSIIFLMGNEQEMGAGVENTATSTYVFEDEYTRAADGRALAFERTYESLGRGSELANTPEDVQMRGGGDTTSELEGHRVKFSRAAGAGEFGAAFADEDDGKEEWLADLKAAANFESFLPEDEVKEGASWELETSVLDDLMQPGGDTWIVPDADDEDVPEGGIAIRMPSASGIALWSELEGDVTARYAGSGVITFEVDVQGSLDVGEELSDTANYDVAQLERSLKGAGRIEWNVESGHLVSLAFEGELEIATEFVWEIEGPGGEIPIEIAQELSGTIEVNAVCAVE